MSRATPQTAGEISTESGLATLRYGVKFGKDMLTRDLALIAGNGEAPDVTANDATLSCLGKRKVLTDKFAIGDLTAEEVSRLGIIDSIIAGEEKQKKSAKMDLMEFTAAADNGLLWHQNNGGAMVQIAMDRLRLPLRTG
jgi:hypothetical protein